MRLNVTHKMAVGFSLMVLLILLVGAGGELSSRNISNHFFKVSDQVVPSLTASLQQMSMLEAVNAQLFNALSQSEINDLNREYKAVEALISQFKELQVAVQERTSAEPELQQKITQVSALSDELFKITEQLLQEKKSTLWLETKTLAAETHFSTLDNNLNIWIQSLYEFEEDLDVLDLAQDLSLLIRMYRLQLIDFKGSGDIGKLNEFLDKNEGQLSAVLQPLAKVAADGVTLKRTVNAIIKQMYEEEGLVDYYNQHHDVNAKLRSTLGITSQLLLQARQSMDEFIALNNQLSANAREQASQSVQLSHIVIIGLSVFAVVFGAFIAFVLIRTIRSPLAHIHQRLAALREGNLTVDFSLDRKDEFGDLCSYLNSVVEGLKDIVEQVAVGAEQLADVANKNASISEQTTQSMNHQSEQLEQTSSAAVEMEHSVSEVASHSKTTLKAVHEFEALSRDVSQQMMDTIDSIQTQADGIDQAMGVSKEMSEFGEQIVSILTSIQGIADKTNLLALNAAIEAARAGEQGRGFAVVADEVRALAGQTGDSVQNIQQMIESLQEAIKRVSVVMNQSYEQTQNCVEQAGRSQSVLKSMNEAVSHIRDLNTFIENAATEQSQAVAEVSQTLVAINAAAAETSQGAGSAAQSSYKLLEVVQKQQGLLSRFSMN